MTHKQAVTYFETVLHTKHIDAYFQLLDEYSGNKNACVKLADDIAAFWETNMKRFHITNKTPDGQIFSALQKELSLFNNALAGFFGFPGLQTVASWQHVFDTAFSKISPKFLDGWFLKKSVAAHLLTQHPPKNIMRFLGYKGVADMLIHENVLEIMASLRFGETKAWMHDFFSEYRHLSPDDFEKRAMVCLVLDPHKWQALDEKFAGQKFHKLSHLKEFGVIFIIPSFEHDAPVSLLEKVVGLLVHYVHEIQFYSAFFRYYAPTFENFSDIVVSLLKGDIQDFTPKKNCIRIIHQYHLKSDSPDPRAFEPHVHPEVLHWQKSNAITTSWAHSFDKKNDFPFWKNGDYALMRSGKRLMSMNIADVAMDLHTMKTYHAHESLWNEIFIRYFSRDILEESLVKGFKDGYIQIKKKI